MGAGLQLLNNVGMAKALRTLTNVLNPFSTEMVMSLLRQNVMMRI